MAVDPVSHRLLLGAYTTDACQKGVFTAAVDGSGAVAVTPGTADAENASFLALGAGAGADATLAYCVGEVNSFEGCVAGSVASLRLRDGVVEVLNRVSSGGDTPCHVVAHPSGNWLLCANYSDAADKGSVAVLPIGEDGLLGAPATVVEHEGRGPVDDRQKGPHTHCVVLGADNFVYAVDLGADTIFQYVFDPATGALAANPAGAGAALTPGCGPRHLVWLPGTQFGFVDGELDNTVMTVARAADGTLSLVHTVSTLPDPFDASGGHFGGDSYAADLHLTPDNKFLFVSNRGHDSIRCFRVDAASGALEVVGDTPSGGKTPRNFALSPDGKLMVVAHQHSQNVCTFAVDADTGALTALATVPTPNLHPVFVTFLP